jgi:LemA protein
MDFGKTLLVVLGVIAFIVLILIIWFISTYNGLVSVDQDVNAKWSQVENQYQRRADLIPNLVETVKGYAKHEATVFEEVAKARTQWAGASTQGDKMQAAKEMDSALSRLMVVVEAYPDLKASESYTTLQAQLEGTENRISTERMRYNDAVRDYNVKIKRIPTSIVADIYGYKDKPFFEADKGAENAPKINFTG